MHTDEEPNPIENIRITDVTAEGETQLLVEKRPNDMVNVTAVSLTGVPTSFLLTRYSIDKISKLLRR